MLFSSARKDVLVGKRKEKEQSLVKLQIFLNRHAVIITDYLSINSNRTTRRKRSNC